MMLAQTIPLIYSRKPYYNYTNWAANGLYDIIYLKISPIPSYLAHQPIVDDNCAALDCENAESPGLVAPLSSDSDQGYWRHRSYLLLLKPTTYQLMMSLYLYKLYKHSIIDILCDIVLIERNMHTKTT